MAEHEHLFIHPLLGVDDACAAYLVESDPKAADLTIALQYLSQHKELAQFDQRRFWFFSPAANSAPQQATPLLNVFDAQPVANADVEKNRALESSLRQQDCKIALKASPSQKLPATGSWDFLLISTSHARSLPPYTLLGLSTKTTIIATEVISHADHEWAISNSCSLTTGEFLLNRHPPGRKADMTRLRLVKLLALLAADADTTEIEEIFRQEPKLAYSLLRLVNSAANSPRTPITCYAEAINILGRRQLQRWLQLLVYADQNNGQRANPVLQKAATRGRMMELLAASSSHGDKSEHFLDAAFMVGTFSLLDILLNMPIKEVLQQLPLPEIVYAGLAEHAGLLGELLLAISLTERRELDAAAEQLRKLGITAEQHIDAQLTALNWANKTSLPQS